MALPWSLSIGRWIGDQFLEEGGTLPRGYGTAWRCPYTHRYYVLPVPLNKIAGMVRNWWIWWQAPVTDYVGDAYGSGHSEGFARGYGSGIEQGIRLARHVVIEHGEVKDHKYG